ncbi:MAG: SocA family protein [Burkholderiales bacterium]|nr:SocA family protein [Burkholderiales bacterium]OJX09067.1 MAG: hypothetical protein BGO72_19360 [Burkholderiales bacterium 70-64]
MNEHQDGDIDRLTKMVHFVVQHTPPEKLGATKLNKVLWFADVMHYRQHGVSISGQTAYLKNKYGPTPAGIYQVLDDLKASGSIAERAVPTPAGARREFLWLLPADASEFSAGEIETLLDVIDWAMPLTAVQISEFSHDALWEETDVGQPISIAAASMIPSEPDAEDLAWAEAVFAQYDDDALRALA